MHIGDLQDQVAELLKQKGFGTDLDTFWEKAALCHTEISELVDVIKKKGFEQREEIGAEIADIIIRTMNFGILFDIDVETEVKKKMAFNFDRPYKYNTVDEQ